MKESALKASYNIGGVYDMNDVYNCAAPPYLKKRTDKEVEKEGKKTNMYSLGPNMFRYAIDTTNMRQWWASSCTNAVKSCLLSFEGPYPLLRIGNEGVPTMHLKNCYDPSTGIRARVALDLDCCVDGSSKPFPSPGEIFRVTCEFLQQYTEPSDVVFAKERCLIFLGSNKIKDRSCHVIFCDLHFDPEKNNRLGKAHELSKIFNNTLDDLGFESDFSVCSSGLRLEFTDKYDAKNNAWRRCVNPLAGCFNMNFEDCRDFYNLIDLIDPHVIWGDTAWDHPISWKQIAPAHGKKSKVSNTSSVTVTPLVVLPTSGNSSVYSPEKIVCENIPDFKKTQFKRFQLDGGCVKLLPISVYCPFKLNASDDQPAHCHATPKVYIFVKADLSFSVHCGVCVGQTLNFESPVICHLDVIAEFNSHWARTQEFAIQLPTQNVDGSVTGFRKLSYNKFIAATRTHKAKIKTDCGKVAPNEYWWGHPLAMSYPKGFIFDPSCSHDPGFYNTWRGFCPKMLQVAKSMQDCSDDDLNAEWALTRDVIFYNLCNSNNAAFEQLLGFFKDMILWPERKPKWAISLHGPQGIGKGLCAQFFKAITGEHGIQQEGGVLSDRFNAYAMEALFVFCDEGVTKVNSHTTAKIKKMVTETEQWAERKGQEAYKVSTCMRILVASNDNPDFLEEGDRRWFVLRGNIRMEGFDEKTAGIAAETESLRGPAAFYLLTQRHGNYDSFDFSKPIKTSDRWDILYDKMSPYMLFVYHRLCLCEGDFMFDVPFVEAKFESFADREKSGQKAFFWNGARIPKAIMWKGFLDHNNNVCPPNASDVQLWKCLNSLFPDQKDPFQVQQLSCHKKVRSIVVPARDRWRDMFAKKVGLGSEVFLQWKK